MNRSSSVLFASSRTLAAVSQADDCLCHVSSHCSTRFLSSLASLSYIVRTAKQNCSLSDAMLYRPRSLALLHTAITSCPAVHIPYAFPLNAGNTMMPICEELSVRDLYGVLVEMAEISKVRNLHCGVCSLNIQSSLSCKAVNSGIYRALRRSRQKHCVLRRRQRLAQCEESWWLWESSAGCEPAQHSVGHTASR